MNQRRSAGRVSGLTALVPLAWAVLLVFHPAPDADDLVGSLRQEADAWLFVHLGSLLFIGLTGAVLPAGAGPAGAERDHPQGGRRDVRALLRRRRGDRGDRDRDARPVRVDLPSDAQATAAGAVQALWDDYVTGDLLFLVGSVAGAVALLARSQRAGVATETAQLA